MIKLNELPIELLEEIYFIRDCKNAIIIQKYWRRKYIYLNHIEQLISYLLRFKYYDYIGIDLTDKYVYNLIYYICNNFLQVIKNKSNKSKKSLYIFQKFFYEMNGSLSEYLYSFLQYNENYNKSINEYIKFKTKLIQEKNFLLNLRIK